MTKLIKSIKRKPMPNIFSMGNIDLIFQLELKKQDFDIPISSIMKSTNDSQNFIKDFKLENIESIKDLSFLDGEQNILWNNIKIKGGNQTLNQLLIANQELKNKYIIDYIGFGPLKFEGEETFFTKIFNYVTLKNFLIINDRPLDDNAKSTFSIEIKYNGKTKIIQPKRDENNKKSEENKINENKTKENKIKEEYKIKENSNENKNKPTFTRTQSILNKMKLSLNKYDLIFLNYSDFKKIPKDFQMNDLFELLDFFKKNGSIIFINFYNQPNELEEEKKDTKNAKEKEDILKKINDDNKLYDLSQIYFFDTEQAQKTFQEDYEYTSKNNPNEKNEKKEAFDKAKIVDYFIKKISNNKNNPNKTGLFLDKLNIFNAASLIKNKPNIKQYEIELCPKYEEFIENFDKYINNENKKNNNENIDKSKNENTNDNENKLIVYDKLIKAYKNIIEQNKIDFCSILISLFIHDSAYLTDNFYSIELINETVQTSIKLIKEKIILIKNLQDKENEGKE